MNKDIHQTFGQGSRTSWARNGAKACRLAAAVADVSEEFPRQPTTVSFHWEASNRYTSPGSSSKTITARTPCTMHHIITTCYEAQNKSVEDVQVWPGTCHLGSITVSLSPSCAPACKAACAHTKIHAHLCTHACDSLMHRVYTLQLRVGHRHDWCRIGICLQGATYYEA
jgi:hypothetical protein